MALASDCIVHTYRDQIADAVRREVGVRVIDRFVEDAHTIAGFTVFPALRVGRAMTINGARGMHPRVRDRFDLTLECIRRWYLGMASPLSGVLDRYAGFFELFVDFGGYTRFFLLDDLVDSSPNQIRFWLPFAEFGERNPIPQTVGEYRAYMANARGFVAARNARIEPVLPR